MQAVPHQLAELFGQSAQRVLFPERQPDGAEYMRKMWSVFMKGLEAEEPRDGGTEK